VTLGQKLKELRESKGLTQTELEKILGIPNQSISNYERDFREPDYDTLKRFAKFFNVSIDYLLSHSYNPNETFVYVPKEMYDIVEKLKNDPQIFNEIANASPNKLQAFIDIWNFVKRYIKD
jgi:transcriptional regulator with XRE-family HTH domain